MKLLHLFLIKILILFVNCSFNKKSDDAEFETIKKLLQEEMNNLHYSNLLKEDNLFDLENNYNQTFLDLFSTPRNHENPSEKLSFQKKLKNKLISYGYDVKDQLFRVTYSENKNGKEEIQHEKGKNLIVELKGKYSDESKQLQKMLLRKIINLRRNKIDKNVFNETVTSHDLAVLEEKFICEQKDKLIVIGAHYDTVFNVTGIDDNGSGSFVLLELARILKEYKYKLNYTIMFAWFDFEETSALGSTSFVNHYLIPEYLKKENRTFSGAIVLDMLLKVNQTLKNQYLYKFSKTSSNNLNQDLAEQDSISIWYRNNFDVLLANQVMNVFNNKTNNINLIPNALDFKAYKNFEETFNTNYRFYFRGDHSSFWLTTKIPENHGLPAILLTNMEPWRSDSYDCYHKQCDDLRQLNEENFSYLKKIVYLIKNVITNLND